MPVIDGLPGPVGGRQIAPGSAGAGAPDDPVDHRAVVNPAASSARGAVGKQRLQHRPLLVGQVMPVLHPTALHPKPARSLRQALAAASGPAVSATTAGTVARCARRSASS